MGERVEIDPALWPAISSVLSLAAAGLLPDCRTAKQSCHDKTEVTSRNQASHISPNASPEERRTLRASFRPTHEGCIGGPREEVSLCLPGLLGQSASSEPE